MLEFLTELKGRNVELFWFGWACFVSSLILFIVSRVSPIQFMGNNAWYKPIKFCLSIGVFSWTIGWYAYYVSDTMNVQLFAWVVIITMSFEIVWITIQAGRGELSHYNISTAFKGIMFALMGIAVSIMTIHTLVIGLAFFYKDFTNLPDYYVWAIRMGIILFVVFSFEGFAMNANNGHIVGSADNVPGIPFLGWSVTYGDLRIAHFIGMQVLPFLSFYLLRNTKLTIVAGLLYAGLAAFVLIMALIGKPPIKVLAKIP